MTAGKPRGVVLVMGAGDAIGAAICRRFGRAGYSVVAARRRVEALASLREQARDEGWPLRAEACDARDEEQVTRLFAAIEAEEGALEAVIFNVGANVPMNVLETDSRKFRKIWEMACFGGFLTTREAARHMQPRRRGSILFTGATASLRGAAGFGAFASAKHGLRAWAQSMARELGPENIHVAHVVIDAAVDTQWIRDNLPAADDLAARDGLVAPDELADIYLQLHEQPRSAWTFEIDVRPWVEHW
ncbi:MAG: SDR family NAD(P)-dependent oxidoreductase [Halieaceae bacterium]|jgi:NAD(P)-dependent dehydrogenase (short-subunit alcohol dehydrogenase family)|nr:SDR family NAD(P)-dependent oxidoreductase [Halieaceae bacterium]